MSGRVQLDYESLRETYRAAREELLSLRTDGGWWEGELSASALSTAVAASALSVKEPGAHADILNRALDWLARDQNPDGGWGDSPESPSNLPTTMLVRAAFRLAGGDGDFAGVVERCEGFITSRAGATKSERADALEALYAPDRTFVVPILANLALAGLADWERIPPLPFELAAMPQWSLRALRLHVVSYALPALIAVGQLLHAKGRRGGPLARVLRPLVTGSTLRTLERIQPETGGFIEAVPLTGFVVMSLAGALRPEHPVAERGAEFLLRSQRADGSWPIDSNLSVWVTAGAVTALSGGGGGGVYSGPDGEALRRWLVEQQHAAVHPYTGASAGGWAWTHLAGGVPDTDDTSGALAALWSLTGGTETEAERRAVAAGVKWLLGIQNSDGGWPTFCRGWGRLPFDRSAPDLSAHAMRAIGRWAARGPKRAVTKALERGFAYLAATQRPDGSWDPLWFGSQLTPDGTNPVIGTARVLAACRDLGALELESARRGAGFLIAAQNADGGWSAAAGLDSTVEETALAVEALWSGPGTGGEVSAAREAAARGARFLAERVEAGELRNSSPIGLYFARLWYSERLYPVIWTVGALGRILVTGAAREAAERAAAPAESQDG